MHAATVIFCIFIGIVGLLIGAAILAAMRESKKPLSRRFGGTSAD